MPPIPVRNALIVDADPSLKALLARALPHGLWAIHYVASNKDALASVLTKGFDLILTGEQTSALQDVELLRTIRRLRPHTRIIILARESTPADVLASMRAHAFSLFSSPYDDDQLTAMIRLAIVSPPWDDGIEIVSATPEWIRLRLRCEVFTADRLVQFLNEIAELPAREREHVAVAFREMLMNAIEHGGQLDPTATSKSNMSARNIWSPATSLIPALASRSTKSRTPPLPTQKKIRFSTPRFARTRHSSRRIWNPHGPKACG